MRKFKKIISLALASALVTSSLAFTVNAAETKGEVGISQVSVESGVQDNVQDGVILHAFNWSYNSIKENLQAIAAAGYSTIQTSPVQQPKDFCASNDVSGQWWKLYQPVSMSIAQSSWLGTKAELAELCEEADKYGIKIICDIVSNHMGNDDEDNPNSISEQVGIYQPEFYNNSSEYFRNNKLSANDTSVKNVVQGHVSKCPDLNTNSASVQNAVISLLKECIDCGVDGFRFDAAKHIETEDDGDYASDYWKNISEQASAYYNEKTGKDLYIYGEILNTCGPGRKYSSYTKYINVTDNRTGDAVLYNVVNGKASSAANSSIKSGSAASDVVLWAESHDTYEGDSGSGGLSNTAEVSDSDIAKAWAIVASREDATALYFVRPGTALMGEAGNDIAYKSNVVSEINKFHNKFVGQSEKLGSADDVAYVARGTSGIVLSNCNGNEKTVSISDTGIADGTYIDTVSGNSFVVSNGILSGTIGETGVAVVYDGTTTPRNTNSVESCTFNGETITLTLGLENATSGTYALDNSKPVEYTGTTTIRIGSDYNYGETITLTLTASDENRQTESVYKYTKKKSALSGVYVFFNAEKRTNWQAPYNVYIYDEDTSSTTTYNNAAWPGQAMSYDEASGYYYYEVPATALANDKVSGNVSDSDFDLAHSANTYVIFKDSSGQQYPSDGSKTKLKLEGESKIYAETSTKSWTATSLIPAELPTEPATEVVKDPATAMVYGDVNGDGTINVNDVTLVQREIADYYVIDEKYLPLADVDGDGLSVTDVTCLQRYIASFTNGSGLTGQVYTPPTPSTTAEPTTQEPTTAEPTATAPIEPTTEEPTTAPLNEYTLYFKTYLDWMTDFGTNLYAYDLSTGDNYQFEKDPDAYPNVYTVEVKDTVSDIIVYRSLSEVSSKPVVDNSSVYHAWSATVDKTNNCVTLVDEKTVSVGAYVEEEKPTFVLDRVYFDNSKAGWSEVYIYGWGATGLGNNAVLMEHIEGTDIWYFDFDEGLSPNAECFLFKNTVTSKWDKQTANVKVENGKNLYIASKTNKAAGTWSVYEG